MEYEHSQSMAIEFEKTQIELRQPQALSLLGDDL